MRISNDPKDRGFRKDTASFKVRLNRVVQKHVITADDDMGMVLRLKLDPATGGVLYDQRAGSYARETVYGVVKINRRVVP